MRENHSNIAQPARRRASVLHAHSERKSYHVCPPCDGEIAEAIRELREQRDLTIGRMFMLANLRELLKLRSLVRAIATDAIAAVNAGSEEAQAS